MPKTRSWRWRNEVSLSIISRTLWWKADWANDGCRQGTDEKWTVNSPANPGKRVKNKRATAGGDVLEDEPANFYLAALCLDPCYVYSAISHNPLPLKIKIPRIPSTAVADILASPTHVRVFVYFKIVVVVKFKSQYNPALKGTTAADVREAFVRQFERYVKGQSHTRLYHGITLFNQAFISAQGTTDVSVHEDENASQEPPTCINTGRHDSDSTWHIKWPKDGTQPSHSVILTLSFPRQKNQSLVKATS
ncbi:hypothetical protein BDR04DRAFT_1139056, partial [Suillus decipiens]